MRADHLGIAKWRQPTHAGQGVRRRKVRMTMTLGVLSMRGPRLRRMTVAENRGASSTMTMTSSGTSATKAAASPSHGRKEAKADQGCWASER